MVFGRKKSTKENTEKLDVANHIGTCFMVFVDVTGFPHIAPSHDPIVV